MTIPTRNFENTSINFLTIHVTFPPHFSQRLEVSVGRATHSKLLFQRGRYPRRRTVRRAEGRLIGIFAPRNWDELAV